MREGTRGSLELTSEEEHWGERSPFPEIAEDAEENEHHQTDDGSARPCGRGAYRRVRGRAHPHGHPDAEGKGHEQHQQDQQDDQQSPRHRTQSNQEGGLPWQSGLTSKAPVFPASTRCPGLRLCDMAPQEASAGRSMRLVTSGKAKMTPAASAALETRAIVSTGSGVPEKNGTRMVTKSNCLTLDHGPRSTLGGMPSTISKLAREVGVKPDTIRYYELVGLLKSPERNGSGYRVYGDDDLERLCFIRGTQRLGLRLRDYPRATRDPGAHGPAAIRLAWLAHVLPTWTPRSNG